MRRRSLRLFLPLVLLLAMLIARSRKKATLTGDSVFDDTNDDAVEIFNFDLNFLLNFSKFL